MDRKNLINASQDYNATPQDEGFFEGKWFYEETFKAFRIGFYVRETLHKETSAYQEIAVYDTTFFGRILVIDGLVMLTERDEFIYHEMISHVPLMSIPDPESVLIIGGGDCGTMREVLKHPSVRRVVQVEIDERVTRVCEAMFSWVRPVLEDDRAVTVFEDGIEYVKQTEDRFDLVMVDSTDPIGPALGLFVRDFYDSVKRILKPGGVLVAQTESPYADPKSVQRIYRELKSSFSQVNAYCATIPTYPIGQWTWCYASMDRNPGDFFDEARVKPIEPTCYYYNSKIQKAAFMLPTFSSMIVNGENPFRRFDRPYRQEARSKS